MQRTPNDPPDLAVVQRTVESRLRTLGLRPSYADRVMSVGYTGLSLCFVETQLLALDGKPKFVGSAEINAHVSHETVGKVVIPDRVTTEAFTPEQVLAKCAHTYMDVTFPALQALFDEGTYNGVLMSMDSVTTAGKTVEWKIFTGRLQLEDDEDDALGGYFYDQPPILLALDSLTGHFAEPRLHWCKLYGAHTPRGLTFGCSIDGAKVAAAEAEMHRKFQPSMAVGNGWTFRQFLVFVPAGITETPAGPPTRPWWWPFGN